MPRIAIGADHAGFELKTFLASGLAFGLLFYSVPFTLLTVSALGYTAVKSDTALAWIRMAPIPAFIS